jgi:hypothetical protein
MSALDVFLSHLQKVQSTGKGRFKACCPAHDDKSPSLAIKDTDGRLLIHCFGGCATEDVLAAVGLSFSDIMPDKVSGETIHKDRKPFYAGDVLKIMAFESRLVFLCASDMAKGRALTKPENERLLLAAGRLSHASEVANNGY